MKAMICVSRVVRPDLRGTLMAKSQAMDYLDLPLVLETLVISHMLESRAKKPFGKVVALITPTSVSLRFRASETTIVLDEYFYILVHLGTSKGKL